MCRANLKKTKAQEARAQAKQTKAKGKGKAKSSIPELPRSALEEDEEDDEDEDEDDMHDLEEDDLDADLDEEEEESEDGSDDDAGLSAPAAGSSTRLDPSLFAKAFARQAALAAEDDAQKGKGKQIKSALKNAADKSGQPSNKSDSAEAKRRAAKRQQVKDRREGIVRGNDGRPMKRLEDGRTVVRALPVSARATKTTFDDEGDAEGAEAEEAGAQEDGVAYADEAFDTLQARPNATARAFIKRNFKRKGGVLHDSLAEEQAAAAKRKKANKRGPQRTYDDPLGLEDPFLMKGGAYASEAGHQSLTGKPGRKSGEKLRMQGSGARGGGGRVSGELASRPCVLLV